MSYRNITILKKNSQTVIYETNVCDVVYSVVGSLGFRESCGKAKAERE